SLPPPPREPRAALPLFLPRYGAHPALHSFPTRRSSDLLRADLRYVWGKDPSMLVRAPLFTFIDESPETHEIRKNYSAPVQVFFRDRKSTRLNSSHLVPRMPSSA